LKNVATLVEIEIAQNDTLYLSNSTFFVQALEAGGTVSETDAWHGDGIREADTAYVRSEFERPIFDYTKDGED
jgi:hypothetical protein